MLPGGSTGEERNTFSNLPSRQEKVLGPRMGCRTRVKTEPGGYLQWGEFDLRNRVAVTIQPDSSTVELKGLQHRMADSLHSPVAS